MRPLIQQYLPREGRTACFYALLALGTAGALLPFFRFIGDDGAYYARAGANLVAGKGFIFNPGEPYLIHPPLYPLLIGVADLLLKDLEFSALFVPVAAFGLTVVPFFFLIREIYPGRAAHWASLLYATNGFLLINTFPATADSLFTLFVFIQLFLVLRMVQGKGSPLGGGILLGCVNGLAFLTRPEGLFVFGMSLGSIIFLLRRDKRRAVRVILPAAGVFLIFFLPWINFVYQNSGRFQLSRGVTEILIKRGLDLTLPGGHLEARKVYEGLAEGNARFKIDELVESFSLWGTFAGHHFLLLKSVWDTLFYRAAELARYFFAGLGFIFVGISWWGVPWDSLRKKGEFVLLGYGTTFIPKLYSQFLPRYFFPYYPVLLIWMGHGLEVARSWACRSFGLKEKQSIVLVFGLCFLLGTGSAIYLYRVIRQFPMAVEYREMGLWMKGHLSLAETEKIASRQPAVSFYSGGGILKLPYVSNFEELRIFLSHQKASYFVLSSDLDEPFRSVYGVLLDESQPLPAGVVRLHTVAGNRRLTLFRITQLVGRPTN